MPKFDAKYKELYIDGQKIICGWESFNRMYWFATEEAHKQDSVLPDGTEIKNYTIYFGFVQGQAGEWGYFSQGEIESLKPRT
jgi:hypothetical protein